MESPFVDPRFSRASPLDAETRFSFICENLFFRKRFGITTYFNFFKKNKNKIRKKTLCDSLFGKDMFVKIESEFEG